MMSSDLQHLAVQLVDDGPDAHHDVLRAVAEQAVRAGASPVLAAIVASHDDPAIARLRAFGHLLRVLDSSPRRARTPTRTAA